jgi:hypothetical protein
MFWKLVRKVVMMIFKSSLNMDRLGSKTSSQSLNIGKPVNILETSFGPNNLEIGQKSYSDYS